MVNLIRNENLKIYTRARSWVMMALLLAIIIGSSLIFWFDMGRDEQANWQSNLEGQLQHMKELQNDPSFQPDARSEFARQAALLEYQLERQLPPLRAIFWGPVLDQASLIFLVILFSVIVAGDSVSGEFATGTIKLLLTRPVKRGKFLFAKYVSVLIYSAFLIAVLLIASIIVNAAIYGLEGWNQPHLVSGDNGEIIEKSMLGKLLVQYVTNSVKLVMITSLAFMLSAVSRSNAMAIGFSIFILLTGDLASYLISGYEWSKFWLFPNMNLGVYLEGGQPFREGMTMGFSLTVLLVYFALFHFLAWMTFTKRDVSQ